MPFTLPEFLGGSKASSGWDPYKSQEEGASTPVEDEPGQATEQNAGGVKENTLTPDEGSVDPVQAELEELRKFREETQKYRQSVEQRFADKDSYINELRQQNEQLQRGLQQAAADTLDDDEDPLPWEDEAEVERIRSAMEQDPVRATQMIYEDALDRGVRRTEKLVEKRMAPIEQQQKTQLALAAIEKRLRGEFDYAVTKYGEKAQAIVGEFLESQGTQGVLVKRLVERRMQPLTYEGGVRSVIADLILEGQGPAPSSQPSGSVTPAARPRNAGTVQSSNKEEPSVDDQVRNQLINARRGASDWMKSL